jgi:hypothetical protein
MSYIPIFIIVHNQFEILKKSVESYEKYIKTPIKIIFHNVASTYEPTLNYLKNMENNGYKVYHTTKNHHHTVVESIKDYINKNKDFEYYVMTDPDIELDNVNGDILDLYVYTLNKLKCTSVGPMLRIDDIPDYYPRKELVIAGHGSQFWNKPKLEIEYNKNKYKYIKCRTDTTFQLCSIKNMPAKFPHSNSIRFLSPYAARHLDWYIDPNNLTPCQKFYQENTSSISHWNNKNWKGTYSGKKIPNI